MVLLQKERKEKTRMNKKIYFILVSIFMFYGCMPQEADPETGARAMLNSARSLMANKDYEAAKDSILEMRSKFPKAFKARTEGIIVMDSIELLQAQDSLAFIDSVLNAERQYFNTLQKRDNRGNNAEYYKQRTKVFYIEQHFDETCAKVKFYLRKIEIDQRKNLEAQVGFNE